MPWIRSIAEQIEFLSLSDKFFESSTTANSVWIGDFKSRDTSEVDFTITDAEDYGWNITSEFEIYLSNTIVLGARGAYTKAQNGENYYFFGLNAGLKFQ